VIGKRYGASSSVPSISFSLTASRKDGKFIAAASRRLKNLNADIYVELGGQNPVAGPMKPQCPRMSAKKIRLGKNGGGAGSCALARLMLVHESLAESFVTEAKSGADLPF